MRIGIDLTWLKPQKSGGVEAFIKNLIEGFIQLEDKNEYVLFLAKETEHIDSATIRKRTIFFIFI